MKKTIGNIVRLSCVLSVLTAVSQSGAQVITFNGNAPEADIVGVSNQGYQEQGYTLSMGETLSIVDNNWNPLGTGLLPFDDDVLWFNNSGAEFTMTHDNSVPFDLTSVQVGSPGPEYFAALVFTGTFGAGGSITQTVQATTFNTVNFAGFTGLVGLNVVANGQFPVIDNITVIDTIPEPASMALVGLAGLGIWFKNRYTKARLKAYWAKESSPNQPLGF